MVATATALQRLYQQGLARSPFATAAEVVAHLGAVQGQDYLGTKWALGLRMRQATDSAVEAEFNSGAILRTHVMRPTWHFVTPADIRWLLELTAPRVHAVSAYMYRQLELDDALFARSNEALGRALEGGRQLTRAELQTALARAGIDAAGMRLGYIVYRAELDTILCSGPRRCKQFTYALLSERAPQARVLARDEALAELTRRYFTGHGPATARDFVWWSGLTMADARAGLAMVATDLAHAVIAGQSYWFAATLPQAVTPTALAFLLPTYDEYIIGYAGFNDARGGGQIASADLRFDSTIVVGGQIVGSWRRTINKRMALIELAPFAPLDPTASAAVEAAAQRYSDFVGLPVTITGM